MNEQVRPERYRFGKDLEISRVLTGLWQVADIEKEGETIDPETGAEAMQAYFDSGFTTFDMADHYGSSEIIAGHLLNRFQGKPERPLAFTKWCPKPGPMTADIVRAGVQDRLDRMAVDRIDLLQFHWWDYQHPAWLDALHELASLREEGLIHEIGVTNFDAAHLNVALADGLPILSNQVSFSLLDRRAAGSLGELCARSPARLLAYGTLCGGFLSERWLSRPEPVQLTDWSKMKYKRFIDAAGGWAHFQDVLSAVDEIARRHSVSIANVATRWVLDQQSVAGVIVGARLGENQHIEDNLRVFSFSLDEEDRALLESVLARSTPLPGDCGDEYRKPPFLTASGDLRHHLNALSPSVTATDVPQKTSAQRVSTGSEWEDIAGYCRAQRVGNRILVSGTTAVAGASRPVAPSNAAAQTTFILDKILAAIAALGGSADDVVRTRIYLTDADDVLPVSRAHGWAFGDIKPANTLVVVADLIGDHKVEIEAEAVIE